MHIRSSSHHHSSSSTPSHNNNNSFISASSSSSSSSSSIPLFKYLIPLFPQLASPNTQRKVIKIVIYSILIALFIVLNTQVTVLQEVWVWILFGDVESQELELMRKSLDVPSVPLRCKYSASLEHSPELLKKYGPVEENWCELKSFPSKHLRDEEVIKRVVSATSDPVSNGSTYFNYPHSSSGEDGWNYFKCPVQHQIRCNNNNVKKETAATTTKTISSTEKQKQTKALVIYIVTSSLDSYQAHQETTNLNLFLKHGLVPANTPTALFDSVDFVFAKIQLQGEKTDREFLDCGILPKDGGYSNIRFFLVPKVPCDLCAHAKILEALGVGKMPKYFKQNGGHLDHDPKLDDEDVAEEDKDSEYDQVILMNNGMRGPFFNSADDNSDTESEGGETENHHHRHPRTTWIDFVSMAGRRKIPNPRSGFFAHRTNGTLEERKAASRKLQQQKQQNALSKNNEDHHDCPIHISTSTTISWETRVHHQSFFLSEPIEIIKTRIFPLFKGTCPPSREEFDKEARLKAFDNCIVHGEVITGLSILWQSPKWAMYSLSKQVYVQNLAEDNLDKKNQYYHPYRNPSMTWTDPCKAIFVKDGGLVFKRFEIRPTVLNAVNHLTLGMERRRKRRSEKIGRSAEEDDFPWDWDELQEIFQSRGCLWKWSSEKDEKRR